MADTDYSKRASAYVVEGPIGSDAHEQVKRASAYVVEGPIGSDAHEQVKRISMYIIEGPKPPPRRRSVSIM